MPFKKLIKSIKKGLTGPCPPSRDHKLFLLFKAVFKRTEAGFHVSHLPEELSGTFPLSSGLLCNHCLEQAFSSC